MIEENTLGRPVFKKVEDEIVGTYQLAFERYEEQRAVIPEGNLHEISYERLASNPVDELGNAYNRLGLDGFSDLETALTPKLPELRSYKKNAFQDDKTLVERCQQELAPAYQRFGYNLPAAVPEMDEQPRRAA